MPTATHRSSPKKQDKTEPAATQRQRRLRLPAPRVFRLKRIERPAKLPSVWRLSRKAAVTLWRHKWALLGIAFIYEVFNVIFVTGLGGGADLTALQQGLGAGGSGSDQLATGLGVFSSFLSSGSGASGASSGAYQLFLTLIISLAVIWVLRQSAAGERARLKEAFYRGMYPLIPFMLVLLVVLLQLLPFLIGGTIFSFITAAGIATTFLEQFGMLVLLLLIPAAISAYMVTASLFALYVVTLPDMTPLQALRSAKKLVHYRRAVVFRKLLFLPVALVVLVAAIDIPALFVAPSITGWVSSALAIVALIIAHTYLYTLYRELLA